MSRMYRTPIDPECGPQYLEQFFRPVDIPATEDNVLSTVGILNCRAVAITGLLTAGFGGDGWSVHTHHVAEALYALEAILEQMDAVLEHPLK